MKFSIKKSFRDSWMMFFSRSIYRNFVVTSLLSVAGLYIIIGLVTFLSSILLTKGLLVVFIILCLLALFGISYFVLVTLNLPLETYKKGKVVTKDIFASVFDWKLILKALAIMLSIAVLAFGGAFILSWLGGKIALAIGLVLASVWVAFVAVRFAFALYILIEAKTSVMSALRDSHTMMKGNGWKFLLFIIMISLISIVAQIVLGQITVLSSVLGNTISILFGILVAPWFSLVTTSPYIQIKRS